LAEIDPEGEIENIDPRNRTHKADECRFRTPCMMRNGGSGLQSLVT